MKKYLWESEAAPPENKIFVLDEPFQASYFFKGEILI
jgi:hypothetical protein